MNRKALAQLISSSLLAIALIFGELATAAETEQEPIYFGSVAMDTPGEMHFHLTPLTEYLTQALNRRVVLKLSTNMTAAINTLVDGTVDFAYLTPVAYVNAHARGNARLVVKAMPEDELRLSIVVRDESPIKTVQDLEGTRLALGDPAALLQRAVVVGAGMPLDKLGSYSFLNHYNNIVRAVLIRDFDAGVVMESTAIKWKSQGLRTIYTSDNLPPYNIAAHPKVDDETVKKVRDALMRLDPKNPAHKPIVSALQETFGGFAAGDDSDYDIVRKLVAPFRK